MPTTCTSVGVFLLRLMITVQKKLVLWQLTRVYWLARLSQALPVALGSKTRRKKGSKTGNLNVLVAKNSTDVTWIARKWCSPNQMFQSKARNSDASDLFKPLRFFPSFEPQPLCQDVVLSPPGPTFQALGTEVNPPGSSRAMGSSTSKEAKTASSVKGKHRRTATLVTFDSFSFHFLFITQNFRVSLPDFIQSPNLEEKNICRQSTSVATAVSTANWLVFLWVLSSERSHKPEEAPTLQRWSLRKFICPWVSWLSGYTKISLIIAKTSMKRLLQTRFFTKLEV